MTMSFIPRLRAATVAVACREARIRGIVTPEDQAAAVLDVGHRPAAAASSDARDAVRVTRRVASAPAAHIQGPRRGSGVPKALINADAGRVPTRRLQWWGEKTG